MTAPKDYRGFKGTAWKGMVRRCHDAKFYSFQWYGARGIAVYEPWRQGAKGFRRFVDYVLETIGPRPTEAHQLDRIDTDRDYEPGNLRWATPRENGNNRRNCRYVTFRRKKLTISQWARLTGIGEATIRQRLNRGWPVEKALTEPKRKAIKK